jgi:hypothetical protein
MLQRSLHNYSVADFLELRAADRLLINRDFQRREVWKTPAKVYLIDSILRGMPIPKMYFRTLVDAETQSSVREVVDGQQRLQAIFQFADNELRLSARAREFASLRYRDLDSEQQENFLAYTFAAEQLVNADDTDVLEVFARINTYTVSLNPAELRHAQWQGEFKWAVHEASRDWRTLWEEFGIVSISQRARMADDELMAQLMLLVGQGILGGEKTTLDKAYRNFDVDYPHAVEIRKALDSALDVVKLNLAEAIVGPLAAPAHFGLVVAATAHVVAKIGIAPVDWLSSMQDLPKAPRPPKSQDSWEVVRDRLLNLASLIEQRLPPNDRRQRDFWDASRSRTINLASRERRFPYYVEAFAKA